jgi:hypothetical protein
MGLVVLDMGEERKVAAGWGKRIFGRSGKREKSEHFGLRWLV